MVHSFNSMPKKKIGSFNKPLKWFCFFNIPIETYKKWSSKKARNQKLDELKTLIETKAGETANDLSNVGGDLYLATRQMQLQQFQELEKARSDGYSGLKQIKTTTGNLSKPYLIPSP